MSAREFKWWRWFFWAAVLGVSLAVWYRLSRSDPTRVEVEALGPQDLDLTEVPARRLASPFEGQASVRGAVRSTAGLPLEDIWVRVRVNRIALAETQTNESGVFRIDHLPSGEADLVCGGRHHKSSILEGLFLGEDPVVLEIELEPRSSPTAPLEPPGPALEADAKLIGKCLSGLDTPCFFEVHLEPSKRTDPGTRRVLATDEEGRGFFTFEDVMPGEYDLVIRAARGPGRVDIPFGEKSEVEVAPGSTTNIAIETPVILLRGVVRAPAAGEAEPKPLADAHLWLLWREVSDGEGRGDEILVDHRSSDSEGSFQLLPVPPGEVRLIVRKSGFGALERKIVLSGAEVHRIELELRPLEPSSKPGDQ